MVNCGYNWMIEVQKMPSRLYLRGRCEILHGKGSLDLMRGEKYRKDYTFGISKRGQAINLTLLQDSKTIKAESVLEGFEPHILQILKTDDYDKLSDSDKKKLHEITRPIRESMKQSVGLIKQELCRPDIRDELIGNLRIEWSANYDQWYPVPSKLRIYTWTSHGLGNMTDSNAKHLQELLSDDEEALVATSYLHQARNAESERYQWIYATIAAELAIKEILGRMEPKLQVILSTLPSPPLNKLYGDVLESVAGVKSEGLNKLQTGAEIRNKLLHSPDGVHLSPDKVNDYIAFIEERIRWLLSVWRKTKRAKEQKGLEDMSHASEVP